jgi:hypothetical protein
VACMNTPILIAIWHMLRKKQKKELFSTKGLLCGEDHTLKGCKLCQKYVIKLHVIEKRHADPGGHQLIDS